jgi:hypothetical protein
MQGAIIDALYSDAPASVEEEREPKLYPTLDCLCTTTRSMSQDSFARREPNPRCPVHAPSPAVAQGAEEEPSILRQMDQYGVEATALNLLSTVRDNIDVPETLEQAGEEIDTFLRAALARPVAGSRIVNAAFVAAVEDEMGMGAGAWDMVNHEELMTAALKVAGVPVAGSEEREAPLRDTLTRLYLEAHRAGVEAAVELLSGTTKGWRTLAAARETLAVDARADTEDEYNWTDPGSPLAQALAALRGQEAEDG